MARPELAQQLSGDRVGAAAAGPVDCRVDDRGTGRGRLFAGSVSGLQLQLELGSGDQGGGQAVFVDRPPAYLREAQRQARQLGAGRPLQADLPGLQHDAVGERGDAVGFVAEVPFRTLAAVGGDDDRATALPRRQLLQAEAVGDEVLDVVEPEQVAAALPLAAPADDPLALQADRLRARRRDQLEVPAWPVEAAQRLEQQPRLADLRQPVDDDDSTAAAIERFAQGLVQFRVGIAGHVLGHVDVEMRLLPGGRIDPDLGRVDLTDRPDVDVELILQGDRFSPLLGSRHAQRDQRPQDAGQSRDSEREDGGHGLAKGEQDEAGEGPSPGQQLGRQLSPPAQLLDGPDPSHPAPL